MSAAGLCALARVAEVVAMTSPCPFCEPRLTVWRGLWLAVVPDAFPVTRGHNLIIPLRHVSSVMELTIEEATEVPAAIAAALSPDADGHNVGVNDGQAAGQSVYHAHIHVIPRRAGDVAEPLGGIRGVVPGNGDYR